MGEFSAGDGQPRQRRWGTFLAFVAQNISMAFAFGSFGPLLSSTEAHFEISRTLAAAGMAMLSVSVGAMAPLVGILYQRFPARLVMIGGALLSAVGYVGLAVTGSFYVALAMYCLLGTGFCILGVIGPVFFVNCWYEENRGRTLGLINLPLLFFVIPFLIASLLVDLGRSTLLLSFAAIFLPLALLLWSMPDKAVATGGARAANSGTAGEPGPETATMAMMMRSPTFWLVSLGIAIIAAAGTGFLTHIVPYGTERGLSLQGAAALLSIYTAGGLAGPVLFGWLADRITPPYALAAAAACQSMIWILLVYSGGTSLYILAGFMGLCLTPTITLHGAVMGTMFSPNQVSKAMGASYLIKLPFLFTIAPLMGQIYEVTGGYRAAFLLMGALLGGTILLFLAFKRMQSSVRVLKPVSQAS